MMDRMGCQSISVYGYGRNVRDQSQVDDYVTKVAAALAKGRLGEIYQIAGNNARSIPEFVFWLYDAVGKV